LRAQLMNPLGGSVSIGAYTTGDPNALARTTPAPRLRRFLKSIVSSPRRKPSGGGRDRLQVEDFEAVSRYRR
jgi:hypothetical protein